MLCIGKLFVFVLDKVMVMIDDKIVIMKGLKGE